MSRFSQFAIAGTRQALRQSELDLEKEDRARVGVLLGNGIAGFENVGGDIDKVTGRRCTFAFFPWNWDRGDGCIIRLVAIADPKGSYRIEKGEKFK